MDPLTQPDQSATHLERLARAELDAANRQLAEAGRTIDELRADALALAERVDQARAEAQVFKEKLQQEHTQTRELRAQLTEVTSAQESEGTTQETLRTTIVNLENHVARLKKQLEKPERLMAKKVLRRGHYAKPDAS